MLLNERLPSQLWEFLAEIVQMGALQKLQNSIQALRNFVACLPNPYKLSPSLGDIWRAIFLTLSSSLKYLHFDSQI